MSKTLPSPPSPPVWFYPFLAAVLVFLILVGLTLAIMTAVIFCITRSFYSFGLLTGTTLSGAIAFYLLRRFCRYFLPLSGEEAQIEVRRIETAKSHDLKGIVQKSSSHLMHSSKEYSRNHDIYT